MNNLNIQYTYHEHKDADGNITDVEYLANSGGCYTAKKERKETVNVLCSSSSYDSGVQGYNCYGNCSKCGWVYLGCGTSNQQGNYCTHTHSLGYFYYQGCGKTTNTIESATIIF